MIEEVAFLSERGIRETNQDAIYVSAKENRGIFVVADGMGGHFGGEIASEMIVRQIRCWWDSKEYADAKLEINAVAEQCNKQLININTEVFSYFSERGQVGGSTVAVLILWDDRYALLSVGDSRIYRVREKSLEQITVDDVWENLPEVKYEMTFEKTVSDARFGKLTEALGSSERLKINQGSGVLSEREKFFLCTDGVYKFCSHRELEKIMCRRLFYGGAERRKKQIRRCVARSGEQDNYSFIVCSVKEKRVCEKWT